MPGFHFFSTLAASSLLGAGLAGAAHAPLAAACVAPTPASSAQVAAPQLMYLIGSVLSADGRPCVGACVFATTNTHQIAVTDTHGTFRLQVPAGAGVQLRADYFGLGSGRITVGDQPAQPVRIVLGQ